MFRFVSIFVLKNIMPGHSTKRVIDLLVPIFNSTITNSNMFSFFG